MLKSYPHNVIRLKKGKKNLSQVYSIIVISNKKKVKSQKILEYLGFFKFGRYKICSINFKRLSYYLNRGYILNFKLKRFIYLYTRI